MKREKGITLIALIITIIVMLILVGVTVAVAINGGLFSSAKEAVEKTKEALKEEMELSQYEYEIAKAKGETEGTFEEYFLEKKYGLKIGDPVNYDEGTGHTTTPNISKGAGSSASYNSTTGEYDITTTEYTNEDLEWRVLGINENGQLELISTKPTTSTLSMAGEEGYLNAKDNLDTFCDDLYGKGEGAESARSLTAEDINKLGNYDPTTYSGYGDKYQYRYSTEEGVTQYRRSTDGGTTWDPDWSTNSFYGSRVSIKIPGEVEINENNTGPIELESIYYSYKVADQIKGTTRDGISIASLISQGLNDSNTAASGSNKNQWLASNAITAYIRRSLCGWLLLYW